MMRFRRIKEEQTVMLFCAKVIGYNSETSVLNVEVQDGKTKDPPATSLLCIPARIRQILGSLDNHPTVLVYAVQPAGPHKIGEVLAIYPTTVTGKDFSKVRLDFAKLSAD